MNPHAGNIGDVIKHLALAETLRRVPLSAYVEAHAGAPTYPTAAWPPRTWDSRWFTDTLANNEPLQRSAYGQALLPFTAQGLYPGSAALAAALLPDSTAMCLYERNPDSVAALQTFLADRPNSEVRNRDGLRGALTTEFGALAFLDPFRMDDRDGDGPNTIEVFQERTRTGQMTLLWFPLLADADAAAVQAQLPESTRAFTFMLNDRERDAAGLPGCGVAQQGLPNAVWTDVVALAAELATHLPGRLRAHA